MIWAMVFMSEGLAPPEVRGTAARAGGSDARAFEAHELFLLVAALDFVGEMLGVTAGVALQPRVRGRGIKVVFEFGGEHKRGGWLGPLGSRRGRRARRFPENILCGGGVLVRSTGRRDGGLPRFRE
jgi:hypothetical protein